MSFLKIADPAAAEAYISRRDGETKLGERFLFLSENNWQEELREYDHKFVLLGIPEDIGVRANNGVGGAHTLWEAALRAICNVQSTQKLNGAEIICLGWFDLSSLMQQSETADVHRLRELTAEIDEIVWPVIRSIVASGNIPIVIGGGHNNAFPLLKGSSLAAGTPVNCINLDAHSDFRMLEGRHSGNGFRYAKHEGYLERYAMVGLHENYNNAAVMAEITAAPDLQFSLYEDIFLRRRLSFENACLKALRFTQGRPTGIEVDLDCIEHTVSSAATPCGITALQARQYLYWCAQERKIAYLHLTEGAVQLRDGRTDVTTGKLVAYLATDFMKSRLAE
jgi:formiminoglutamase